VRGETGGGGRVGMAGTMAKSAAWRKTPDGVRQAEW
jgi:hypothetical protein